MPKNRSGIGFRYGFGFGCGGKKPRNGGSGSGSGGPQAPPGPQAPAGLLIVRNVASGTGDGSSLANAAAFANLPALVAAAAPDTVIGLYNADVFTAQAALLTGSGGTVGHPIVITGIDTNFNPALVTIQGTRNSWTLPADPEVVTDVSAWGTGADVFKLKASNITFRYINHVRCGCCFDFNHTSLVSNITIEDCQFYNIRSYVDHNNVSSLNAAEVSNVAIRRITGVGISKKTIRARGKDASNYAHNWAISYVSVNSGRQDGDNFSAGLVLEGFAQDVTCDNCAFTNFHDSEGNNQAQYWNADGSSSEETNPGLVFTNYVATGNTDAGIDLKTAATIIGGAIGDNKRNMKFWSGSISGKYHVEGVALGVPNKRGGTGGACHINLNHGGVQTLPVEVRCKTMDLRVADKGWTGNEVSSIDSAQAGWLKYINCQRDAAPAISPTIPDVRFSIAAADPIGSITLNSSSANMTEGTFSSIAITTNRDASYGGVVIRSITGAAASLFQIDGVFGYAQSISPASPIAYTGTGADAKSIILNVEDISGNTAALSFTVNIQQDTTDHRVLDVTFTGANNAQTATDASPAAHTITYGANAKISTTGDAAGRLRINFTANGTGTGRITSADSPDWVLTDQGPFTVLAIGVQMDVAATALKQTILAQNNNTSSANAFRLGFDATGHPEFLLQDSSGTIFTLSDPTARTDATSYDLKVTREFLTPGAPATYRWKLWVNGAVVATVDNTNICVDVAATLAIGATSASRDYMAGYIKRIAIFKGTATGS